MIQYEYKVTFFNISQGKEAGLNELGRDGWELVSIDRKQYIFKRPAQDVPSSPEDDAKDDDDAESR